MTGTSAFSRYIADVPPVTEHPEAEIVRRGPHRIIPATHSRASPTERLLAWVIDRWPEPIITLRDIQAYGPYCARDPTVAMNLTKKLSEFGWLVPVKAWRNDQSRWKIVRGPNQTPSQV